MIDALDHIAVRVPAASCDETIAGCEAVLGHRAERRDGGSAVISLANMALAIEADLRPGATAALARLAFRCPDIARAERVLARRAVAFERTPEGLAISTASSHGVPVLLRPQPAAMPVPPAADPAAVIGLDHVVIRTPNPERAVAIYAGRLGLDLRLDRTNPDWGSRLLFFVCGDLVIELSHNLKLGVSDAPDQLWGLSWRAADIERLHARMVAAGVAATEIRPGRRPSTRVFTVRSHTAGVPTLVIGGDGLARN